MVRFFDLDRSRQGRTALLVAVLAMPLCRLVAAPSLLAEDVIDRKGSTTALRGDVTEVTRTEVVLKGRTNQREYRIGANEIERIRWGGEKPQMAQYRIEERNGQFDKALEGYEQALKESTSENLTTDLEFLIARTTATKALEDEEGYDDAIKGLEKFVKSHSQSFRYFEALKYLARLTLAKPDVDKANTTMKLMSEAPWTDFKMETDILQARVALAHDKVDLALKSLDRAIAVKTSTPAEASLRFEAQLTKAKCLQKQGKFQEAVDILTGILDGASDEDVKTLAETCIHLGDCYQAAGRTKEAILAYLRVDVLFPREKAQHAEALYYLSRLFAQDGKFDKAAEAQARLQQTYPRSQWTAKLTAAPK